MEKQSTSTSTSSPTTSESSTYSIHDPPGYINPYLQDMLLTDITAEELLKVAERLGVDYLGPAAEFPCSFPKSGKIHGNNKRLMVSLSCCREGNNSKPIDIIFLIDTGSPNTFLSDKAMEALAGKPGCNIGSTMDVMIHSDTVITCHLSPHDKHFSDKTICRSIYTTRVVADTIGNGLGDVEDKWQGGFLANDGKIYGIPECINYVMVLTPGDEPTVEFFK